MISLRRPSPDHVTEYHASLAFAEPTCTPADIPPPTFHRDVVHRSLGSGRAVLDQGRLGLEAWAAHRGAGVDVFPDDAALAEGTTVALVTRQLGLWVLAGCRVTHVVDEEDRFGFTYATLPDHPEEGYETFLVVDHGDEVRFTIEAVSRPATPLVELGLPVTRALQRRATNRYLDALQAWVG